MVTPARNLPIPLFIFILTMLFLSGCSTSKPTPDAGALRTPTAPAASTPTPTHPHTPAPEAAHALLGSEAAALVLIRRLDGVNKHEGGSGVVGERFGIFAIAADMDGDGTPDLIVGIPRADPSGTPGTNEGTVPVYSGAALLKGAELEDALLYQVN